MHSLAPDASDLANARTAHVLGNPVKHSLSPLLHNAAYKYLNLDFKYSAIETDEFECSEIIDSLTNRTILGLSLTMPFKELAFRKSTVKTQNVTKSLSANTLVCRSGEIAAENTDIYGIIQTLKTTKSNISKQWTVLGTGATARSAVIALQDLNATEITVIGRDKLKLEQIQNLYQVDIKDLDSFSVSENVISTIPATVQEGFSNLLSEVSFLFDVTYANWPSSFSQVVSANSGEVINGLPMLVHQAASQIEIMTGRQVPAKILFAALPKIG